MPQFVGDVFGLTDAYSNQVQNVEKRNLFSWPESPIYGYVGGGLNTPTTFTRVTSFIDYSTEVLSENENNLLTVPRHAHASVSSFLYGYFGGGYVGPVVAVGSNIDRTEFSTQTNSIIFSSLTARAYISATQSDYYGYFGGGFAIVSKKSAYYSTITRFDFSGEVTSESSTLSLPSARDTVSTVRNNYYGYFAGGFAPPFVSTISRLDFATETMSDPGKNYPTGLTNRASISSYLNGYFAAGDNPLLVKISTIDRLEFSSETVSSPGNPLPSILSHSIGASSGVYGYFVGGGDDTSLLSTVSRLDFSNETISSPGKNNIRTISQSSIISDGQSQIRGINTYGYFGGGADVGAYVSSLTRLDFASETVSNPTSTLNLLKERWASVSSNNYGYFGGGYFIPGVSPPTYYSQITRLDFSNEVVSEPGKNLSISVDRLAATSSNNYGYFGGGVLPSVTVVSIINRIDFATENTNRINTTFSGDRHSWAATSSNNYGYFGGGAGTCNIFRLDFSNETVSDPGNTLSANRNLLTTVSSNRYGYFGGGRAETYFSTITRLDFSSETLTNLDSFLSQSKSHLMGVSNSFYGYFGGGYFTPVTTVYSTIDRLDFTNETRSTPVNKLPGPRRLGGGLSNSNTN